MNGDSQTRFPGWHFRYKKLGGANSAGELGGIYEHENNQQMALFKRDDSIAKVIAEAVTGKIIQGIAEAVFKNADHIATVDLVLANPENSEDVFDANGCRTYLRSIIFTNYLSDLWQQAYKCREIKSPARRPTGGGGFLHIINANYRQKVDSYLKSNYLINAFCQQVALRILLSDFGVHAGNFGVIEGPSGLGEVDLVSLDFGAGSCDLKERLFPFGWDNKSLIQIHKNHLLEYGTEITQCPTMAQAFLRLAKLKEHEIRQIVSNNIYKLELDKRFTLKSLLAFCYRVGMSERNFANPSDCLDAITTFYIERLQSRCQCLAETGRQLLNACKIPIALKIMIESDLIDADSLVESRQQAIEGLGPTRPYRIYVDKESIVLAFKNQHKIDVTNCRLNYANMTLSTDLTVTLHADLLKSLPKNPEVMNQEENSDDADNANAISFDTEKYEIGRRYITPLPTLIKSVVIGVFSRDLRLASQFIHGWEKWAAMQWHEENKRPFIIAYLNPTDDSHAHQFLTNSVNVKVDFVLVLERTVSAAEYDNSITTLLQTIMQHGDEDAQWCINQCHEFNLATLKTALRDCSVSILPVESIPYPADPPNAEEQASQVGLRRLNVKTPVMGLLGGMGPVASSHYLVQTVNTLYAKADEPNAALFYWSNPTSPLSKVHTGYVQADEPKQYDYRCTLQDFLTIVTQHCHFWVAASMSFSSTHAPNLEWMQGLSRMQDHHLDSVDDICKAVIDTYQNRIIALLDTHEGRQSQSYERSFATLGEKLVISHDAQQTKLDQAFAAYLTGDKTTSDKLFLEILTETSQKASVCLIGSGDLFLATQSILSAFPLTVFIDVSDVMAKITVKKLDNGCALTQSYHQTTDLHSFLAQLEKSVSNTRYWHKPSKQGDPRHDVPSVIKGIRNILSTATLTESKKHAEITTLTSRRHHLFNHFRDKSIAGRRLKMLLRAINLTTLSPLNWNLIDGQMRAVAADIEAYKVADQAANSVITPKKETAKSILSKTTMQT